jgi:RNA polymerase primary sigma factor
MDLAEAIRRAIKIGSQTGAITFDQLDELLPSSSTEPEVIEAVMAALNEEGINVTEA